MWGQNPHAQTPYTFVQGPRDRFPRTQGLGDMQEVEGMMTMLEQEKNEANLRKDIASYEQKSIGNMKEQMKHLMEALKGGRAV